MKRSAAEEAVRLGPAADLSKLGARRRPLRWFIPVPARMALDPGLSSTAFRLASLLLHYEGHRGCFPAQSRLAADLGISVDSVQRYIRELELYGFLKRSKSGKRNRYELLPLYEPPVGHGSIEETGQLEVQNVSKRRPPAPRTLHRRHPNPPPSPPAAPVRSITDRAPRQRAAPVRPISELVNADPNPLAAPVRPINDSEPPRRAEGLRLVASQEPARLRPDKAAPVRPNEQDTPHPCGTINNLENNNYNHQDDGVGDVYYDDETTSLDDALGQLQRVKVNLDISDLTPHLGRGRCLTGKELTAWAQWVRETSNASIINKCGFAAAKIRMGCNLEDVFPEMANARIAAQRALADERERDALAKANRERQEAADRLIAAMSVSEREELRNQAIKQSKSWLSGKVSSERTALALQAIERRLVLDISGEGSYE
jgi:hypothetical protein